MCGDDMDDFAVIYRQYSPSIFKYLYYQTQNRQLAEELLQETFFQAFKSLHSYRGNSQLSTWLYGIARNVLHREWAKKRDRMLEHDKTGVPTPESIVTARETQHELLRALAALETPYREVVILRAFNELSFRQIGEVLGKDENWSRVTFYRAKLQLKASLS